MQNILNTRVLILNQTYEPLAICRLDKAIILTFLQKADVVSNYKNITINSSNKSFAVPSIIKLNRYVKMPYKKIEFSRRNILKRDNHTCQYCGSKSSLTVDHVHPKSRGGQDTWENLTTACVKCNNKKGNRTPKEANMVLISEPYKPSYHGFLKTTIGKTEKEWEQFLYF